MIEHSRLRVREAYEQARHQPFERRRAIADLLDAVEHLHVAVERGVGTPDGRYYVGVAYCNARRACELEREAYEARMAVASLRRAPTTESVAEACEVVADVAEKIGRI